MKWLAYRYWRLRGWRFLGELPDRDKLIVIGAPHTSNWDFVLYLAALHAYRLKPRFIGKHTLFRWPFGYFFRALGGMPVDRTKPGGVVGQVVSAFEAADRMTLVMAPEGTRGSASHWKSGFLQMSEASGVPVVLAGVDGANRHVEIGPMLTPDGDTASFMNRVRAFFEDKSGLIPSLKGPVVLANET